jgi:hypothetical protein
MTRSNRVRRSSWDLVFPHGFSGAVSYWTVLLAFVLLLPAEVAAQTPPAIAIAPTSPSSTDVIQVAVNTNQLCRLILPTDGVSVTVVGSSIQILASLTCPAVGVPPPPFGFNANVGPLPSGHYQIEYSMRLSSGTGYLPPQLLGVLPFDVTAASAIPALSGISLGVLIAVLAIAAYLTFYGRAIGVFAACAVLGMCAGMSESAQAETLPADLVDVGAIADRQLILLFDPRNVASPKATDVVAAANDPSANSILFQGIGEPEEGSRLLEGFSPPELVAQLAVSPMSRRSLLEQFVVLTFPTSAAAAAAKRRLTQDARVLSVESNGVYGFSSSSSLPTVPNDQYFSRDPNQPSPGNYFGAAQRAYDRKLRRDPNDDHHA